MNFRVKLLDTGGSKRPLISNGFLRKAKAKGQQIASRLKAFLEKGTPIIVCEPSAFSALKEDIPDLLDDEEMAKKMQEGIQSVEAFVADFVSSKGKGKLVSRLDHHLIHAHCHQKAMEGTENLRKIFDYVSGTFEILDAGCCGMAGAFGFEKEHYDFSKKIFDGDLGKKLANYPKDQLVLASGFSCRHQIKDLGDRPVKHWVEVLDYVMD
jgi:Fe-S oxidoreductase